MPEYNAFPYDNTGEKELPDKHFKNDRKNKQKNQHLLELPVEAPSYRREKAGTQVSLKSRRATSALGLRHLQPYVLLCCGTNESAPASDTCVPAEIFFISVN